MDGTVDQSNNPEWYYEDEGRYHAVQGPAQEEGSA